MKLKKKRNKKYYNLINFNLFDSRIYLGLKQVYLYYQNLKYLQGFKNNFCIFELFQTKIYLKKIIKIIYYYHYYNCKILFVGFPESKVNNFMCLFKSTKHYYIPANSWIRNIILNKTQITQHLQFKVFNSKSDKEKLVNMKNLNKILKIKKTPDLIVVFDDNFNLKSIKEEMKFMNIPTILFLNNFMISEKILYKVPGNFYNKNAENFVYFLLKSVLTLPKLRSFKKFSNKKFKQKNLK